MKKRFKAASLVAVLAVVGFCGVKAYNASQVTEDSLIIENIEALSQTDNGSSTRSYQHLGYGCSAWVMKLYCSNSFSHDRCKYHCL